ncbi:MAG: menaquinone biosynthesis decarboxylase [Acidobacteriota bacterium]
MAFEDLREFLKEIEKDGELLRIKEEIDPCLEMTQILDRAVKENGPAILFENVKGSKIKVVGNILGTHRRMLKALGLKNYSEIDERISSLMDFKTPQNLLDKIKMIPELNELSSFFPKIVKDAPCKEIIQKRGQFSLKELPIPKCWPLDGGAYITLPMVFTKDRESGKRNCGMYRMQVFSEDTTGMHWHPHKHGAKHALQRKIKNEKIEVAVAIGADPATYFSAAMPLPDDIDEMMFAGFIRKKSVELVKCETVHLEVPANSEIVLEGWVDPNEVVKEGPFGDHTGFYSLEDLYPVFHVECVTMRKNPIYPHTIVGKPPMEDAFMGYAIERIALPVLKKQFPEIVDMHIPFEGVFHNLVLVSIEKRYPGHARKIMHALWGMGQMMFTKVIVVVDKDVDIHNSSEVVWKVLNHIDPKRDFEFAEGPVDVLDHSSPLLGYGSKVGIDATKKWKEEGFLRQWPDEIKMDKEIEEKMNKVWERVKKGD